MTEKNMDEKFLYQKLFKYMDSEHNCILLESDLQQIYNIVNDDLQQQLCTTNEQLSVAKEALEFYAKDIKEDENWYEIAYDEGKKAKQALTKIEEIENE